MSQFHLLGGSFKLFENMLCRPLNKTATAGDTPLDSTMWLIPAVIQRLIYWIVDKSTQMEIEQDYSCQMNL
jgi:hypothetical protein